MVYAGAGISILIVDENTVMLDVLSSCLAEWGYSVRTAEAGGDAVIIHDHTPHDIVLIGDLLSDMEGAELVQTLKAAADTKIIGLSGKYGCSEFHRTGAECCIIKPFSLCTLRKSIESLLRGKHAG